MQLLVVTRKTLVPQISLLHSNGHSQTSTVQIRANALTLNLHTSTAASRSSSVSEYSIITETAVATPSCTQERREEAMKAVNGPLDGRQHWTKVHRRT